jgi:hypothetical protein
MRVCHKEGFVINSLAGRILGVAGTAVLSVAVFSCGIASAADPLAGQKYSDAASAIAKWNGKPVIGTITGSEVTTDDCIVTSWHMSKFLDASGHNMRKNEYILNLNCTNRVASPGHPGNSVMTPEGAMGKRDQKAAAIINKDPTWCNSSDERLHQCQVICKRSGLCEI